MKDSEVVPVVISLGALILALLLIIGLSKTISDRMVYQAFATAQTNVLACRVKNISPIQADQICGPVPNIKDFTYND
jgi:hypothetical protein